ncbi:MAG: M56 family metallopeptidase [Clostridiales bacterium]|jgi:beta-lactamase regulating signal transducer with metallopeptidase domain|nr:M56 family metallopeptidase [Clostridiales bacterium]
MSGFLPSIFQCAVSMSLISLVYAALTPLLSKRYDAKWRYGAWLAIAAGWAFPFRPRIELPFLPFLPSQSANMPGAPVWPIANAVPIPPMTGMTAAGGIVNTPLTIPVLTILAAIWILGVVGIAAYHVLQHGRFMKMARRWSEPVTDTESLRLLDGLKSEMGIRARIKLNVCQSITSPMLIGFFHPVILLPPVKITGDELYFVLKHELVHFQRGDLWGKSLILMATILHWFNPAVYLMAKAAAAQCEIACDALVLLDADFHKRKQYGETIIGVVRNGARLRTALSTNLYGGKNGMKNRIFSIMDTRRKRAGLIVVCLTLLFTLITGATFAFGAAANGTDIRETGYKNFHFLRDNDEVIEILYPDETELLAHEVYKLATKNGSITNVSLENGNGILLANDDGNGWNLKANQIMPITIDIDLSAEYSDKENGEIMGIGYYHNGRFSDYVYCGKVTPGMEFSFFAPETGDYCWYMVNYCASAQNLSSVSVSFDYTHE